MQACQLPTGRCTAAQLPAEGFAKYRLLQRMGHHVPAYGLAADLRRTRAPGAR